MSPHRPPAIPSSPRLRARSGRPGVALILTIAGVAALALLAAGLLASAVQRGATGEARAAALRARLAAVSGANAAIAGWSDEDAFQLAVGQWRALTLPASPPVAAYEVELERLAGGLFLLRSEGEAGPDGAAARAAAAVLVRALDPGELGAAFPAAMASGGDIRIGAAAHLDALRPADPPPPWPSSVCPVSSPAPAPALLLPDPAEATIAAGAVLEGEPPVAGGWLPGGDALPPLGWLDLAALADRVEVGTVTPAPRESGGTCRVERAENWGAPLDPHGPCGGYFPLIHAPADLRMRGGTGQGVLAVEGSLTLENGAAFYGAVLVRGPLVIEEGSVAYGAAIALAPGSEIRGELRYGRCAALRAITESNGLSRPLRPSDRHVLPAFPPMRP